MRNRQIFLVSFRRPDEAYPPFGLMYVADALEQAGFHTEIFHDTEDNIDSIVDQVYERRPLFVGFSTIIGPMLLPTIKASRRIQSLGIPIVWGGVHATIMPIEVLKEDYVDFVVVNEGEETIVELAHLLYEENEALLPGVLGLAHKDKSGQPTFPGERSFIDNLDKYRPRWEKIDVAKYLLKSGPYTRALPLPVSRGCPFRCGFCYNSVVMKRTWRRHSDVFIMDQIQWLKRHHKIDAIDFADDYLFGHMESIKTLIEGIGMPWSGQVRVHMLSPEFVVWMRDTKCQWVNIGIESGSQKTLDRMDKDLELWQIDQGVGNLITYAPDVEINLSFIVGLPEETIEERNATLELIDRLASQSRNVRAALNFYLPFPGTPLWPKAIAQGFEAPKDQTGWGGFDNLNANLPWLDAREARAIRDIDEILFVGRSQGPWLLKPYYGLLRWRWHSRFFKFYWEGAVKRMMIRSPIGPILQKLIKRFVEHRALTHKGPSEEA